MPRNNRDQREFTGRHMLLVVSIFFGVVIAVNGALAYFANQSWSGLIVRNGYIASKDYNKVVEEARRADLGWRSSVRASVDGVTVTVTDTAGAPVAGLEVDAMIGRRTHEHDDRVVRLQPVGGGDYRAWTGLAPGVWKISVDARDSAGRRYRQIFDVNIPKDG